jgi:hypothetical protein
VIYFPLTLTLSPIGGEEMKKGLMQCPLYPLLGGEGWGEGG